MPSKPQILLTALILVAAPILAGCTTPQGPADNGTDGQDGTDDQNQTPDDGDQPSPAPAACEEDPAPGTGVSLPPGGTTGGTSGLTGDGLDVTVRQDDGKTVYWVLPGERRLSQKVFGTAEDPRFTGDWQREAAKGPVQTLLQEVPFLVGAPKDLRETTDDGRQVLKAPTLFSDKARITSGKLQVTYQDRQPYDLDGPPGNTEDKAQLSTSFTDPEGNIYEIEIDHIVQPPIPGYRTQGGVMTNSFHHGSTGTGSPLMPQVFTYGAFWAIVDVSINGERVNEGFVGHFMTTQTVRDADYRLAIDEELPLDQDNTPTGQEHHTHGVVFPIKGTPDGPVHEPLKTCVELPNGQTQPFIHIMFEEDDVLTGPFPDTGGQGLDVTVEQTGEKTFYWVLPGKRELSQQVFGTAEEPRMTGQWAMETAKALADAGQLPPSIPGLLSDLPVAVGAPEQVREPAPGGGQQTKIPTLFSDKAAITSGEFEVTYKDRQPWDTGGPPGDTLDTMELNTTFTDPAGNEYKIELNHTVKPPIPGYETGGGVLTNALHHGQTGTGSPLMPQTYTYGAFWALGDLFVRNETTDGQWEQVDRNVVTHFMTTQTLRNSDYEIVMDEDLPLAPGNTPTGSVHHTHGVMFPIKAKPGGPVHEPVNTSFVLPNGQTQPFIHAMWEEETITAGPFKDWTPPEQSDGGDGGGQAGDADRTIQISGSLSGFNQSQIDVEQGQTVKVAFKNTGSNAHNWGVDLDGDGENQDDARTDTIQPGDTDSVTFTVAEAGEFAYFCDIAGHRQSGMEGTMTVS